MQQAKSQSACTGPFSPRVRKQGQRLCPKAVVLHTKLRAPWLRVGEPALSRAGQLQCQATAKTPGQLDSALPLLPDISMLSPELQQQWHVDENMHLGAIKVKPYSAIRAVWKCSKCPAGQPHVWTTSVANRTRGTKCPYCVNTRVCLHNSLAMVAPGAARYWDHSKNAEAPEQVLAGRSSRAHWTCPACKYEWLAPVFQRVRTSAGCPKCSLASKGKHFQPTFAEAQPAELAEWDHAHNEAEGFCPHLVTLGSGKLVHWICSCCPRGQPHRWRAPPYSRVRCGVGCAVCGGKQACVCNSLESLFPSLAAEFDVEKTGFAPSEVTAGSGTEVWWRNAKCGSWRQSVDIRTQNLTRSYTRQAGA
ncbi:hypothetical protein ABBQ32_003677 [Trebouxia sp. C0010 RCD-2024]